MEEALENFDLSELIGEFRDEARAQAAHLDDALLTLDAGTPLSAADRQALLRALHTLKGNAGMLGLHPLRDFVHTVEGIFKQGGSTPDDLPLPLLHRAATLLRQAVDRAGTPEEQAAFGALQLNVPTADAGSPPAPPAAAPAVPVLRAAAPKPAARPRAPAGGTATRADDLREATLRVPAGRLDTLLSRVADLAAEVAALEQWVALHRGGLRDAGLERPLTNRVETLAVAGEAVRRSAAALRTVPVGRLFARFPALARDIARERDKQVRVIMEGEATELDKSTADALAEPLLHLVRNAVDHGIEPVAERRAVGKPAQGTLWLRATPAGDRVRIEVEDDGRGLNRAAIRSRAAEQGVVPADAELAGPEVDHLIFRSGFSTRQEVTDVSGRGVGLDVVRERVLQLRGSVEVQPGEHGGTTFTLQLPLNLALVPALFFEADGETFALPADDVDEAVRAAPLRHAGAAEVVTPRDEPLPLIRLARLFGRLDGEPPRYLVVVRRGGRSAAVGADRLLAQRPAAVRALPAALGAPRGVSGATVDARGHVVLVLDVEQLLDMNIDLYRGGTIGR